MSIRRSMPLLFLSALILWNVLLVFTYQRYIANEWADWSNAVQQDMSDQVETLGQLINSHEELEQRLAQWSMEQGWSVHISNAAGETLFNYAHVQEARKVIPITENRLIQYQGETALLTLEKDMALSHVTNFSFIQLLFISELILCALIFISVWLICHVRLTRPIQQLKRGMEDYQRGVLPMESPKRDEIGYLQNAFVDLTRSLEAERTSQTQIIASISHDIKTPLTSILGCAEQLQKEHIPAQRKERYLVEIHKKARRIQALVSEFDDYLSFGLSGAFHMLPMSLPQLHGLILEDFQDALINEGVTFQVGFPEDSKAQLMLDIDKIRRLFGNIIENALHFLGEEDRVIALSCVLEEGKACFRLTDHGPGVSAETLAHMFDLFYTTDSSRTMSGLGLATCRRIAQAHGGAIWAEQVMPHGLCIVFELPCRT